MQIGRRSLSGAFRTLIALSGEIWMLRASQMANYRPKTPTVSGTRPKAARRNALSPDAGKR